MTKITADIEESHPDKITLTDVPFMLKDLFNTVPGLHWDRKIVGNTWRMNLGWASCLALRSVLGDNLVIGPRLNEWAAEEKRVRIDPALALRESLDAPGLETLYPFQRAGVMFLKTAKRAICADDMGTGKTRQAIATLMSHYIDGIDPFPALIVCPNSTKMGWKREFEEVWPGLDIIVVQGNITQRRKQLATPAHVYLMNWEAVRSHSRLAAYGNTAFVLCTECGGESEKISAAACHAHEGELNKIDFKSVVADECHRLKDGAAQQTRALKYATGDADIRIAMSGTPIANNPIDLWSILNWISPEEWPSKTRYVDRMVNISMDMWGKKTPTGIKSEMRDEFFSALNPRLRRMPKELVLPFLPPVVYERKDIEMSPKQKKAYEQMRDQMIAELDNGEVVTTTSALTKSLRLLQFSSSFAETEVIEEWDEDEEEFKFKTKVYLKSPSNKVDAFISDMDDFGKNQVVVFAASKQLINLLGDKLEKKGLTLGKQYGLITGSIDINDRQTYMDRFQAGHMQFMLCTTGAGGTGITLTAANTAVFLQRPWSMIESQQSEARIRRIGSEIHDSITIIDYVSIDTLDEMVIESLLKKDDMLQEILRDKDLLRRLLTPKETKTPGKKKDDTDS